MASDCLFSGQVFMRLCRPECRGGYVGLHVLDRTGPKGLDFGCAYKSGGRKTIPLLLVIFVGRGDESVPFSSTVYIHEAAQFGVLHQGKSTWE